MDNFYFNNNGNSYYVKLNTDTYEIFKLENNELKEISEEEKTMILPLLEEKKNQIKEDYLLNTLKEMVKNGQIKDTFTLQKYLSNSNISQEEKEKILNAGYAELKLNDIVTIKNKIINDLRNNQGQNLEGFINFKVRDDALSNKFCEIKLGYKNGNDYVEHLKYSLNYNETLQKELIEPVALEIALRSPINTNVIEKSDDPFTDLGNVYFKTNEKMNFGLENVDYAYAHNFQKRMEAKRDKVSISDNEKRDEAIAEEQNKEYNPSLKPDENGLVKNEDGQIIGYYNENGEFVKEQPELNKGTARVLKKNDTKGFTLIYIILGTSFFLSGLAVLLQIIFLSK